MTTDLVITDEFKAAVKAFKADFRAKYKAISKEKTPEVDGTGRKIIDRRPDGYDFIIEAYMREALDKHFPGWSWVMGGQPYFCGSEWIVIWGTLTIVDEHLVAFGINPPTRCFSATNAVRVKYKSGKEHTADNIVDIGNDVSAANSKALKKAINQLTHIGDDVYGKRIEEEGMGTLEDVIITGNEDQAKAALAKYIEQKGITYSKLCELAGVSKFSDIVDYKQVFIKVKKHVEGGDA